MNDKSHLENIDWSKTSFEGAERENLRGWRRLTLDQKLRAVEDLEALGMDFINRRKAQSLPYINPDTSELVSGKMPDPEALHVDEDPAPHPIAPTKPPPPASTKVTQKKLKAIPLPGLTLDTLGLYFAALGLLRLLSRKWPQVRGCWRNGVFTVILGPESSEELEAFVFEVGSTDQWSRYGKPWDVPQKADTKAAQAKKPVSAVAQWRAQADELELTVLASHLVPGEKRNSFNPIFGTGGNAGKRLFSSGWTNAKEAILQPKRGIAPEDLRVDLRAFLNGDSCSILGDFGAGCWFSLANKVYNSGFEKPFAGGQITPWAMLVACETFPLLAGSTSRLIGAHRKQNAAFPFVSRSPAPESETACGQWLGDFWAPVWQRPLSVAEVTAIFQSGKAELGGKAALTSAAFAGAIVQRGVDAGLAEFRCFTLQRTTSDNTFESRLSRVIVIPKQSPLFSEFFRRAIALRDRLPEDRKQGKSWRYKGLQGALDRILLDFAQVVGEGDEHRQFEAALAVLDAVLGALEKVDRNKSHREAKVAFERLPLDFLAWLAEHEGGSTEFRLAVAIASLKDETKGAKPDGRARLPQPFLAYRLGATGNGRFWKIPKDRPLRAIWSPRDLVDNLCALARRRLIESPTTAIAPFRSQIPAPLSDVLTFLHDQTDDALLARWLDRLSLFDWSFSQELRNVLKAQEQAISHWSGEAALYAYFRPLLDDGLLRGLQRQIAPSDRFRKRSGGSGLMDRWAKQGTEPLLATAGRLSFTLAALNRGDAATAWAQARSAFHAERIPIADFGRDLPFATPKPRRLLAALIIPATAHQVHGYFSDHWQSPSQPKPILPGI